MRLALIILFLSGFAAWSQILIEEPSKDLGEVFEKKGAVVTKFILQNPYPEDTIFIKHIETSCGCTAVLSQDTLIKPNSSIELKVSYDPTGRIGLFVKSVEVISTTGRSSDPSSLFLRISGIVIDENPLVRPVDVELEKYRVAPIYFYAITAYDTSYLDFSYIGTFVNDLTFEIDFFQFTTIGFEITVENSDNLQQLEYLLTYSRKKLLREFQVRGFSLHTVFFDEPIFKYGEVPEWATAKIKAYSVNFVDDIFEETQIVLSDDQWVDDKHLLLNFETFAKPSTESVMEELKLDQMESKLFINGSLHLNGLIYTPARISYKDRTKLKKDLEKRIFKSLKKSFGANKKVLSVSFDSLAQSKDNKFRLLMWDRSDESAQQSFTYEVKKDKITPPLLPTYKQSTLLQTSIDQADRGFKRFWKNIILNHRTGNAIKIIVEYSVSRMPRPVGSPDHLDYARSKAKEIGDFLQKKFNQETGRSIEIVLKPFVHGPNYSGRFKEHVDYSQYEYLNLIPLVHHNGPEEELHPNPYMVNFDYFFNGVDTSSFAFSKFAKYLAKEVEQEGFVELLIESSISQIPIEKHYVNDYIVYRRANESEKRIKAFMQTRLIDPNRILFKEQRYLIQGPKYDGSIPIIKFREFQYLKVVPSKHFEK